MQNTGGFRLERELLDFGYKRICGLDEAGRGCLAGPVVAAACILDPANIPSGIDDSKKLTATQREDLYPVITGSAISWSVGIIDNIILNPGALTHYSYSIHDAIKAVKIPTIEVHISNIYTREGWRAKSVISPAAKGVISGFGIEGYRMALRYLLSDRKK